MTEVILFPEGVVLREIVVKVCQSIGFTPRAVFEAQDIVPLKGLVATGLGITLIPEMTLMDSLSHDPVKVPIIEPEVRRNVGIIISKERRRSLAKRLFYDFTVEFFANLMDLEHELVKIDPFWVFFK